MRGVKTVTGAEIIGTAVTLEREAAPVTASPPHAEATCDDGVRARLATIERRLASATPGVRRRDCAGRIFATIDGEELQIGEAYASGDARLWCHAAADVQWLVQELRRRLETAQSPEHAPSPRRPNRTIPRSTWSDDHGST